MHSLLVHCQMYGGDRRWPALLDVLLLGSKELENRNKFGHEESKAPGLIEATV